MTDIKLNPVTIGKTQMDQITQLFADATDGAEPILAEQLTGEVAQDYPDLITYEGLRDGTAPLFDQLEGFKDQDPLSRGLTNAQIISLFAVDEQGDPIQEGTFAGGLQRGAFSGSGALAGMYAGAKAGYAAQTPIPPAGPLALAVKLGIPLFTSGAGALAGAFGGEKVGEMVLGPEKPVTPGSRAAYEAGITAGGAAAFLPMPFMISKNIAFGGAQYLDNLAQLGPPPKPGMIAKLNRGAGNLLSKTGTAARGAPIATLGVEAGAGAGSSLGAFTAETFDPGDTGTRLMSEVGFGIPGAILAGRITSLPNTLRSVKDLGGKVARGEFEISGLKKRRQTAAVNRILDVLESEGEDIDAIIERLASQEFTEALVGPDGKPITLTAGMKADSPALMAIEQALAQSSPGLGKERVAKNIQANNALRNTIAALVATGDPNALKMAAEMAEELFSAGMATRLQTAASRQIEAAERVRGVSPESNMKLSQDLFDLAQTQLSQARGQEKRLWSAVDDMDIMRFVDSEGNELSQPNFITAWQNSMPKTPEAAAELNKKLGPLASFVQRKMGDLGLDGATTPGVAVSPQQTKVQKALAKLTGTNYDESFTKLMNEISDLPVEEQVSRLRQKANTNRGKFSSKRSRDYAAALDAQAEALMAPTPVAAAPTAPTAPLSVREITEMRQSALNLARQLTAQQDYNGARVASAFAEGLLDDLNSLPEGANAAYDIARSYSRSLNDTFTRAFAGTALEKGRSGAERIAPELLANRLMTGGSDPTFLRIREINDIGKFAIDNGFEGAEEVAATLRGTTEMIVRNARAAAFDPETGEINTRQLSKWMNENEELLDTFPALKADLEDARTAQTVLADTRLENKSRTDALKGEVTFKNLLSANSESPTYVVSRALSSGQKAPVRSLNNLLKVAQDAPEEIREDALSGLKHAILEWGMTKGGATSRSFSPSAMYDNLFSKIPNANEPGLSVMKWMKRNDVISEQQANQLEKYLTEMVRLEKADSAGTLADIAEGAGPMLDFYLRITGSAIGSRAQALMPGGGGSGGLIAASAGSKAMRNIFDRVPESMKLDVMSELMEDPELLAAMMRKPRNDREKVRIAGRVGQVLEKLGFISATAPAGPVRRAIPQAARDDSIPEIEQEEAQPTVVAPPAPAPAPLPSPNSQSNLMMPPAPRPAAQGPVDRNRFAAVFPEDRSLIEGIGSLRG